jgi:dTDP-4-dehydrorhamnose 3,5-epimerase-like enzyme
MIFELIDFKTLGDDRGELVALEENKDIPFDIKRIFYIYGNKKNILRGRHSHYKTKQFLISVNGSCKVTLDDGKVKKTFDLNKPNLGLFQDALIWGTMHDFSSDCVLIVLASEYYDENDYIRDYDLFLKVTSNDS